MTDAERLSPESQVILAKLRAEIKPGQLSEDQVTFVADCMRVKESLGFLGNVVIKLAVLLGAISAIIAFRPWERS